MGLQDGTKVNGNGLADRVGLTTICMTWNTGFPLKWPALPSVKTTRRENPDPGSFWPWTGLDILVEVS